MQPDLKTRRPFFAFSSRLVIQCRNVLVGSLLDIGKLLESLSNNVQTLAELLLGNNHGRSEADNVAVGRLGQETLALEKHAQVPGSAAVGGRLVNDAGIQETLATDNLENGRVESSEAVTENLSKTLGVLNHLFLLNQLESTDGNGTAERVATIGRTVGAGLDNAHNLLAGENGADGVHAARNGLAKSDHVGLDARPLGAEHAAGAANASLNLVGNENDVVLLAESLNLGEVVVIGDHDTSLTLNGLNDDGGSLLAVGLEDLFNVGDVVVSDGLASGRRGGTNVGDVGAIVVLGLWVGGECDGGHLERVSSCQNVHLVSLTYSAAVEVVRDGKDESLALLNALDLVSPLAGNLDGSLGGLGASVHGQNHVVAKDIADLFSPLGEDVVVESAGAESEGGGLLSQSLDEFRVAMALVDSAVGREEVHVLAALGVPDVDALGLGEDDGERVVVVSSVLVFGGNGALGGRGVEARGRGAVGGIVGVGGHDGWFVVVVVCWRGVGSFVLDEECKRLVLVNVP